jgi:biofilm protein TabA
MIIDTFSNWKLYSWTHAPFRAGFEFLESLDPAIADGKYEIDGDNVYAMVQTYETKPASGYEFETHRVYADIQYLISGRETILWAPHEGLTVVTPYEPDVEMQAAEPNASELFLDAGRFAVFFPDDAHAPCLACPDPSTVRKVVVKVRL